MFWRMITQLPPAVNMLVVVATVVLLQPGVVSARPFENGTKPQSNRTEDGNGTATIDPVMAKQVWMLSDKFWSLDLCPPNIQIKIGNRMLSKRHFYCNKKTAMKLAPMLLGDTLEERVYVWCRMAYIFSMEDDNNSNNNNNNNKGNGTKQTRKTFEADSLMFFEDDIQLRRADVDFVLAPYYPTRELQEESLSAGRAYESVPRRSKRKMISPTLHWSGAVVPFILDEKQFNAEMKKDIIHAISEWERLTCVRFTQVERGPRDSSHVVVFKNSSRCSSPIGRRSEKDVVIRLSEGCIGPIIQHEIGHTLGMFHEQSRPDRDHYVEVITNNAKPIVRGNFMRQRTSHTFGVPYDYTSVMHYADDDFSKAKGLKTIRTRDPDFQDVIGQRVSISFYDAKTINAAYCSRTCGFRSLEWTECKNGGYRNPNNCDECVCPEGLAPPFCEEVDEGINVDCGRQELTAKADEQVLTSPGFDSEAGMGKNTYCPWLITAATPGKRVHIRFVGRFNFYKNPSVGLCEDRVEVRYKTLYTPGPRFCTGLRTKKEYFSFGSQLLIGAQTLDYTSEWQGFQATYKEENCGGCSSDAQKIEPFCYKQVDFTCQPDKFTSPYRTFSWFRRPYATRRDLKCKRDEPFCCQGYKRSGEKCIRSTTPSSPETPTGKPETAPVTSTTVTPQTRPSPDTTTSTPETRSATPETTTATPETKTATPETKTTTSETKTTTPEIKTTQDTTTVRPASTPNEPTTTTASSKSSVSSSRKPAITTGQSTTAQPKTATLGFTFPPSNVWFPWGRWSPCSASCGLCGLRTRTRVCFRPPCQGHSKEKELCGVTECKEETITEEVSCQKVKKSCKKGWFSNVNKDCIVRSTCAISKTSQRCCHGEPDGGVCTIYFGKRRFPVFE